MCGAKNWTHMEQAKIRKILREYNGVHIISKKDKKKKKIHTKHIIKNTVFQRKIYILRVI